MKHFKKIWTIFLAIIIAVGMLPVASFALPSAYSTLKTITFTVPHGADLVVSQKPLNAKETQVVHYVSFIQEDYTSKAEGDESDTYSYELYMPDNASYTSTLYSYRVSKDGYMTETGCLGASILNYTITLQTLDNDKRNDYSDSDILYDDGLLMNVNDSEFLKLNQEDKFQLKAYRTWQIIDSISDNFFLEPDWHYEVAYYEGDSPSVSIDENGLITAIGEGVSVIRVTYDAIKVGGYYYNATDPVHTGTIVVSVGGADNSELDTGIDLTEFDTIYYTAKQGKAQYTFTPSEGAEVRVQSPHQENWDTGWKDYTADSDGSYTIELTSGKNIVEIKKDEDVLYHVIRASEITVNITNKANPTSSEFSAGDTVRITFDGLYMPLPKMAAIYNPGYMGSVYTQYDLDGTTIKGKGVQYDLRNNNRLDVTLDEAGTYTLTNGCVHLLYFGGGGNHREIPESGREPNFGAAEYGPYYFDLLPDITIEVKGEEGELSDTQKLNYANLSSVAIDKFNTSKSVKSYISEDAFITEGYQNYPLFNGGKSLSFTAKPVNSDVSMLFRYWKEGDSSASVSEVTTSPWTFNTGMVAESLKPVNGELIVIPNNNEYSPKTYAFKSVYGQGSSNNANLPYLSDLLVTSSAIADFSATDGKLKAESVTYGAINGDEKEIEFGYGFLVTESKYTAEVPYSTTATALRMEWFEPQRSGYSIMDHTKTTATITVKDEEDKVVQSQSITGSMAAETTDSRYFNCNEFPLKEGNNTITILIESSQFNTSTTYELHIIRRGEPSTVTMDAPSGTSFIVKNSANKKQTANSDGTYSLEEGNYTYIASKSGYITKSGTFTVEGKDKTVSVELNKSPEVSETDTVTVSVVGGDSIARSSMTVNMTDDADELDLVNDEHYVQYNAGTYTALHAIIAALNSGTYSVDFNCYNGNLTPLTGDDEEDTDGGWICEVNDKYVADPANYLLSAGDKVVYYYSKGYEGMVHAWFDTEMFATAEGKDVTVQLLGTTVGDTVTGAAPLEGVTILANSSSVGTTDAEGKLTLTGLTEGTHAITAEKKSGDNNLLTYNYCLVKVSSASTIPEVEGKTTVKFRLIGDAKHTGSEHGTYVTWIATEKLTFDGDSVSVYDVFTTALDKAGLDYVGADNNYVSKIKAPKAYGGYWLGEFDNGKNSGWMYTVNGEHPAYGLKEYYVTNGDYIIWHYVDDYTTEENKFTWLEADDENPPTDGTVTDMSKGNKVVEEEVIETGNSATATVTSAAKVDATGKATALILKSDITEAITKVTKAVEETEKEKGTVPTKKIIIEVTDTENANSVETTIPKSAVAELEKNIDVVTLKTAVGEVSFDKTSFATLAKNATGDLKLTITKEEVSKVISELANISDENKAKIEGRPMFELKVEIGGKTISDFDGNVTVKIPYAKTDKEQSEALVVYWLQDSGELTPVLAGKLTSDGKYVEMQTKHWSRYVIGYNEVSFTDTTSHWAKSNITYLAARDVIKGKSETTFAPNSQITRAEFVQILANLSGADLSTYGQQSLSAFNDVKATSWYAQAAAWAKEQGVAEGTNGKFNPNANITRQDMAVMITRYVSNVEKSSLDLSNSEVTFADDAKISSYAKEAVANMQKAGIISGVKSSDQTVNFNPTKNATRAEAATMIANYTNN